MKSNQERSNGCLPPKKREILALEHRPVVVAAATPPVAVAGGGGGDSPHAENLAWLASVASERCRSRDAESPRCPVSSSISSSTSSSSSVSSRSPFSSSSSTSSIAATLSAVPLAAVPGAVYPEAGTIQYAQLAPGLQFISSGPYAGYISSHIIHASNLPSSSSSSTAGQRPQLDACYTTALISPGNKAEHHHHQQQHLHHHHQQQFQIGLSPADLATVSMAGSTQVSGQYVQLDGRAPLVPLQLHPQAVLPHTLTLAPQQQLLLQYADGPLAKKPEGQAKALLNGEPEGGKQPKAPPMSHHHQVQSYETRHILVPADYGQSPPGLQTSLVLVAQPSDPESAAPKLSLVAASAEKGAVCVGGKPASRASPFTSLASNAHTTALAPEELPAGIYSSSPISSSASPSTAVQPPIIGYIASALPQHLLIPVSAGSSAEPPAAGRPHLSTAMHHTYLATALKCEPPAGPPIASPCFQPPAPNPPAPAAVAPVFPAPFPAPVQASSSSSSSSTTTTTTTPSITTSSSSPVALPPFFMRGSIIQLADGELKRVEDLRTEDFIQSAEISSELKIDSSTVERIDNGPTPNAVVIQFAVGELKAQVCVEVLVEYPFFVFGQGWSSCCPDRTTQLFELSCAKLCVGDVCVSLTLRGLRNGTGGAGGGVQHPGHGSNPSRRREASGGVGLADLGPLAAGSKGGPPPQTASGDQVTGPGLCGVGQRADAQAVPGGETGTRQAALTTSPLAGEQDRVVGGRKRRWSAPERDQTERAEGEPPLTLPKPSFIPHEVKISIEGRSSTGS